MSSPEYFQNAQSRTDWKMNIATPEQQAQILKLVAQGLDDGALGIGINAGYAPGHGQKEYFALAELAAERNVATFTHVRYASNMEPQSSFQAVQELIANAAITGAHMHLCHINSTSLRDIHSILKLVDDAFERNINISVGAYPWGAASTVVGAAMFTGEGWRERMGSTAHNFQLGTKRMTEAQLADYQKNKPGTFITWHFLDESNPADLALLDASILHPRILIESDEMFWMFMDAHDRIINYDWRRVAPAEGDLLTPAVERHLRQDFALVRQRTRADDHAGGPAQDVPDAGPDPGRLRAADEEEGPSPAGDGCRYRRLRP